MISVILSDGNVIFAMSCVGRYYRGFAVVHIYRVAVVLEDLRIDYL